jgi:hypothetical protein
MTRTFEVRWEGALPAASQDVWDAITRHSDGYLWKIDYEPWVGGAERGLTQSGGTVTAWDEPRHFATRAPGNALDYRLEPLGAATYLRYTHHAEIADDGFDDQLAACRAHTALYNHSLGQYACFFAGRPANYVSFDVSATFAGVRAALGVPEDAVAGDPVAPCGIDAVVDYVSPSMLGLRSADALYRVFGRDTWGWPVGLAQHRFGDAQAWTADMFETVGVA